MEAMDPQGIPPSPQSPMLEMEKTGVLVLVRGRACLLERAFTKPDNLEGVGAVLHQLWQDHTLTTTASAVSLTPVVPASVSRSSASYQE